MTRIVLLILAVLVFFWLLRRSLANRKAKGSSTGRPAGGTPADGQDSAAAPELVACARCGVLVPKSEAFVDEAAPAPLRRFFCCEEHRRQGSL